MTKDDANFYLLLGQFAVGQANAHSDVLKMFLNRFETLEQILTTAAKVSRMPDDDEKEQALAGLHSAVERLEGLAPLSDEIRMVFARHETHRERLEACLRSLEEWVDES